MASGFPPPLVGFSVHAPFGRFKTTSLSKDFGNSDTSRKVAITDIKRLKLKAARYVP